jgi:hypothetical protein
MAHARDELGQYTVFIIFYNILFGKKDDCATKNFLVIHSIARVNFTTQPPPS